MWRMWEEHICCVQNDQKWLPLSLAHCQYSHGCLLLCFTCWGLRNIPFPFRQRLGEYLRHKWIVTWSNSCLWKKMSWRNREAWRPFTSEMLTWPFICMFSVAERRGRGPSETTIWVKWTSAAPTGHLACGAPATECAFSLFKILPLIGRKIAHSWVTKSHLCSVASWNHLIPIYLIWTVLLFQNLMQIYREGNLKGKLHLRSLCGFWIWDTA